MKKAKANVIAIAKRTFPTDEMKPAHPDAILFMFEVIVDPIEPIFDRMNMKRSFQSKTVRYFDKKAGSQSADTQFIR